MSTVTAADLTALVDRHDPPRVSVYRVVPRERMPTGTGLAATNRF